MPACVNEKVQNWPLVLERARAGSSSSASSNSSELGSPCRPGSPADWTPCPEPILTRLLGWYPALVIRLARQMVAVGFYLLWNQIFVSMGLWIVDCILHIPLSIAKLVISVFHGSHGLGRTVLITGSSVETLQIARNFYRCGTRVIIAEHDDKYGLIRFSTVADKIYKVPVPQKYPQEYVRELCTIAERENVTYFVPTSTCHPAHFDALAKIQLEKLGIKCMCPGLKEVSLLDDPTSLFMFCQDAGLSVPVHFKVTAREELSSLYEGGQLQHARHVLFNTGSEAIRDMKTEFELPQTRRGYRRLLQTQPSSLVHLSVSRPSLVVQIPEGERLISCTTVREGHVVANVTCRAPLPEDKCPSLVPLQQEDVEIWLQRFFAALPPNRTFTGHVSFTLVMTRKGIVPISCRLGIALPYLCYTSLQPRVLMRPCRHHHQSSNNPDKEALVSVNGYYWLHDLLLQTLRSFNIQQTVNFVYTVLRKNEVLFQIWDPLPSFVFYGIQVPVCTVYRLFRQPSRTTSKHTVHFSTPESSDDENTTRKNIKIINLESYIYKNGYKNGHTGLNGFTSRRHNNKNIDISNGHYSNGIIQNGHVTNYNNESNIDLIQL